MNCFNPTNISALAALFSAIAAFYSCRIALRSQQPDLVVYIDQDADVKYMLFLCVTNVGQSTARNIRFQFNQNIPHLASDTITENSLGKQERQATIPIESFITKGFFKEGLTHLAPNKTRKIYLGHYLTLEKHFSEKELECTVTYENPSPLWCLNDKTITNFFRFSISDWAHDPIGDNSHLKGIKDALLKIAKK